MFAAAYSSIDGTRTRAVMGNKHLAVAAVFLTFLLICLFALRQRSQDHDSQIGEVKLDALKEKAGDDYATKQPAPAIPKQQVEDVVFAAMQDDHQVDVSVDEKEAVEGEEEDDDEEEEDYEAAVEEEEDYEAVAAEEEDGEEDYDDDEDTKSSQPHSTQRTRAPLTASNNDVTVTETICENPPNLAIWAACGSNYSLPEADRKEPEWNVVFYGPKFMSSFTRSLLACPERCPLNPNCKISYTGVSNSKAYAKADVIVVHQNDHRLLNQVNTSKRPETLLGMYWREAHYDYVPIDLQRLTDFEIGVHHYAKVLSPNFLIAPSVLQSRPHREGGFEHRKFAIFVASDCNTLSKRETYLARIMAVLRPTQRVVDTFGSCFDRRLPGVTIDSLQRLMTHYKFYFAFENTIQDGYTTEKLFSTIFRDVLPVYFGSLDAPNITLTPSYIRASDFKTPELLAQYLIYLDENPSKYHEYFAWKRQGASAFDPKYLEILGKHFVGPKEKRATRPVQHVFPSRNSACCRLCNSAFIKATRSEQERAERRFVPAPLSAEELRQVFYDGEAVVWKKKTEWTAGGRGD